MIQKFILAAALVIGAVVTTTGAAKAQQQQQLTLKATHGAWEVRCAPDNANACLMVQDGKRGDGEVVIKVGVQNPKGATAPDGTPIAGVLTIEAPIGVALLPGVAIKIDGKDIGRAPFQFCSPSSCIVNEPVADTLISQMKKGTNATMTVVARNGETAELTISLSGFTKAFNSL